MHSARIHVKHLSPDAIRARDTDRDIGNVCASDVQSSATLQSAKTIRFGHHKNKKTADWADGSCSFRVHWSAALSIEEDSGTMPTRLSHTGFHGQITQENRSDGLNGRGLFVVFPRVFPRRIPRWSLIKESQLFYLFQVQLNPWVADITLSRVTVLCCPQDVSDQDTSFSSFLGNSEK